jgi:tetratricopeptide (TPR) repeat protein
MMELVLQRTGSQILVKLGDTEATAALADLVLTESTWQQIHDDAQTYGRRLFQALFSAEQQRMLLAFASTNNRLLLVAEDPLLAAVPWEYLRDQQGKLLASRVPLVRGLPAAQRQGKHSVNEPLEILAVAASPTDTERLMDSEVEWRKLITAITTTVPSRTLTLKRVRPPTREQLKHFQSHQGTTIIHFMGHGICQEGKNFLVFEDMQARSQKVDIVDFVDTLAKRIFLVVLDSCLSAAVGSGNLGNLAGSLVQHGIPYALVKQYNLPDDATSMLNETLYSSLLQSRSLEETVMHLRRALEEPSMLAHGHWLAGVPVLYTSLQESGPVLELTSGPAVVEPNPRQLEQTHKLSALSQAPYFIGRQEEIAEAGDVLLAPEAQGFVLLRGLGGIGKTSLAHELAERVSWYYEDRVLACSFAALAHSDLHQRGSIDEIFEEDFLHRLARFYQLDPIAYPDLTQLQAAILAKRTCIRSLLVFDAMETVFDTRLQERPVVQRLCAFLSRLREGNGITLFASRQNLPADWGTHPTIVLAGLSEKAGAALFYATLPEASKHRALSREAQRALSRRVQGHPLSICILAARFAEAQVPDLETFLAESEAELQIAEQRADSTGLEDFAGLQTLSACLTYSIARLTPEQTQVLQTISLFQTPFPPDFAARLLEDEQAITYLPTLLNLGLLAVRPQSQTFSAENLRLLELHPMIRQYINLYLPPIEPVWHKRHSYIYASLLIQADKDYDKDAHLRYLVGLTLPDSEAALKWFEQEQRSKLAYYLARSYERIGRNRRALTLYEEALAIDQQLGDAHEIAANQHAIGRVLIELGKLEKALCHLEEALATFQKISEPFNMAATQHTIANVLWRQGKPERALSLLAEASCTIQQIGGKPESVAAIQNTMADILVRQGRVSEALAHYKHGLHIYQKLDNARSVALTRQTIASLLIQQDHLQEAQTLLTQSLRTFQELNDLRQSAVTQQTLAQVLTNQGRQREALDLFREALHAFQILGELRNVAAIQHAEGHILASSGRYTEAFSLYEQALKLQKHPQVNNVRGAAVTQMSMANVLIAQDKLPAALTLMQQALRAFQDLGDLHNITTAQQNIAQIFVDQDEAQQAHALFEQALLTAQQLSDVHEMAVTQANFSQFLFLQGETQRALAMVWESYINLQRHGYVRDALGIQENLLYNKWQLLGSTVFDTAWAMVIHEPQPSWLRDSDPELARTNTPDDFEPGLQEALPFDIKLVTNSIAALLGTSEKKIAYAGYLTELAQETTDQQLMTLIQVIQLALFRCDDLSQSGQELTGSYRRAWDTIAITVESGGIGPEIFVQLTNNTLAVLGSARSQSNEWKKAILGTLKQAKAHGDFKMASLLTALVELLDADGKPASLGNGLQGIYARTWQTIVEHLPK